MTAKAEPPSEVDVVRDLLTVARGHLTRLVSATSYLIGAAEQAEVTIPPTVRERVEEAETWLAG